MILNPEQLTAVHHTDGPLLIIAGAGSGKTRVLVERVKYMIQEKGIFPEQILVIAFTNKAVHEIRQRIAHDLSEQQADQIWISTFHALGLEILRKEWRSDFTIASTHTCRQIVKELVEQENVLQGIPPIEIMRWIGLLKNELVNASMFEKEKYSSSLHQSKKIKEIENLIGTSQLNFFKELFVAYQQRLSSQNSIDVDDILLKTVILFLKNPSVLEKYQERFRYISIDEYQDTNHAQYIFVRLLAKKYRNLAVVGDDHQSIFGFRGANIQNILRFKKDFPEAFEVKMEKNYRSTAVILQAANELIAHNPDQTDKKLESVTPGGDLIRLSTPSAPLEEAEEIANTISILQKQGYSYRDFAVFYRNNADSSFFETTFSQAGIPFALASDAGFFEREEIRDILAYLEFLENPSSVYAFSRIVNKPKRSIGQTTIQKIITQSRGGSLLPLCKDSSSLERITGKTKEGLIQFSNLIIDLQEQNHQNLAKIIEIIIEKSQYKNHFEGLETFLRKEKEVYLEKLVELAMAISAQHPEESLSIGSFLKRLYRTNVERVMQDWNPDAVTLSTIHSAKGLEFPVVFLTGMREGSLPSARSETAFAITEERRLCFVAFTRAKTKLFLSYPLTYFERNENREKVEKKSIPSRFLSEFDENLIEKGSQKK